MTGAERKPARRRAADRSPFSFDDVTPPTAPPLAAPEPPPAPAPGPARQGAPYHPDTDLVPVKSGPASVLASASQDPPDVVDDVDGMSIPISSIMPGRVHPDLDFVNKGVRIKRFLVAALRVQSQLMSAQLGRAVTIQELVNDAVFHARWEDWEKLTQQAYDLQWRQRP